MNQGMNINFNFNNKNTIQNTPKFNTKSYNLNSDVNYSRLNNNNNTTQNQKFKSVTGRTFDNYENVRIENQRFMDQLSNNK